MSEPKEPERLSGSFVPHYVNHEWSRFADRVTGALLLDDEAYADIDRDSGALAQAFVVVIGAACITGLGNLYPSLVFLGVAGLLFAWLVAAALIWAVGTLATGRDIDYARLLRCLGFAYVWVAPFLLSDLWWVGWVFKLGGTALLLYSFVLATRQVLGVSTGRAGRICLVSLIPIVLIWFSAG